MKKLKEKVLKTIILLTVVSSTLPFFCHDIYAESVGGSSPIIGVNITYVGYDGEVVPYQTTVHFDTEQTMWRCTSSHSTMGCQVWESENINGTDLDEITGTITTNATSTYTYRLYQYEFIFDKTYVGSITFNGNHPGATTTTTYFVNGNRLVLTDINLVTSFTIGSYSLTYAPLEVIDYMKQWDIPIESFSFVNMFFNLNKQPITFVNYNYYSFPVFSVTPSDSFYMYMDGGGTYYLILGVSDNLYNLQQVNNNIQFSNSNIVFDSYERLFTFNYGSNQRICWILKLTFTNSASSGQYYMNFTRNLDIIPIYWNRSNWNNISTDFALNYNLSNKLLDNLNIIAQGTQSSNTSVSNLEDNSSDFDDVAGDVYNLENSFNTGLNSSLQQIDTSFDIGNTFGSKFLLAADWVRVQFNTITASNPFGTILSFSLLLGVALLIIGKVLG